MKYSGFDWDRGNKEKCQKHGLSLKEIENFFKTKKLLVSLDVKHSQIEQRFSAINKISKRGIFIIFTFRIKKGKKLIRPISARYMHKKEQDKYA